jgi:hypothetical protein
MKYDGMPLRNEIMIDTGSGKSSRKYDIQKLKNSIRIGNIKTNSDERIRALGVMNISTVSPTSKCSSVSISISGFSYRLHKLFSLHAVQLCGFVRVTMAILFEIDLMVPDSVCSSLNMFPNYEFR